MKIVFGDIYRLRLQIHYERSELWTVLLKVRRVNVHFYRKKMVKHLLMDRLGQSISLAANNGPVQHSKPRNLSAANNPDNSLEHS